LDNKERLKEVKNLEELVNFKVRTLADHFHTEQQQAPYRDGRSHQRLAAATQLQSQASIDALKKSCDPLLANRHYPKLLSKKPTGAPSNPRRPEEEQR